MAKSYLHGNVFKVYGVNIDYTSVSDMGKSFLNSVFIREIDLMMADKTGSGWSRWDDKYLYKWNSSTQTSDFQEDTATFMDSIAKNWQLGTLFVYGADTYVGNIPVQQCLNLFPNHYKFEDFGYNTLFFTRDDINSLWAIHFTSSSNGVSRHIYAYNKTTLESTNTTVGINLLIFHSDENGSANTAFYFYDRHQMEVLGFTSPIINSVLVARYSNIVPTTTVFSSDFLSAFQENYIPTKDPYDKGGSSGTGGGTGTFDGTSDNVDFPSLPTLSASETGFISLFNPTIGQLKNLSSYMWSDAFSIEAFKKMFADPMDAILGLSIVPVAVPEGGSGEITVGNIPTGITMTKASSQYVEVDCGTLDVKEYWGAYLDYDPYTKAELYLPYCGIHPIKTDDIMNKSVHIKYHVDILSGSCCAYVKCGESVLYTFSGSCSCSIPITSADFTSTIVGAISIASSIGTMVATGGMSAPISMGGIVDAVDSAASAADIVNMKPSVERSGSIGSMAGMLAIQTPYLILTRPNQCLPKYQNTYEGYPAYLTETISNLSGYTIFEEIHLNGMSCTDAEKNEIENLLKSGVIL